MPQHAWCEEAFSAIAKTWGRVIIPDECSTDNTNMAFGRVGIITSQPGSISQTITIKVDNDVFNIIVMEDILESNRLNPIIASNDFITSPVWKDWGRNCDYSEEEEDEDDGEEIREWEYNGNNRSPEQAPTKSRWTENFKAGIKESLPHNDWGREDAHSKASKPETPNKSLDASPTSDAHSNRWSKMTNPHNPDHITQNTDSPIQESANQVAQNSSPVPETQINSEKQPSPSPRTNNPHDAGNKISKTQCQITNTNHPKPQKLIDLNSIPDTSGKASHHDQNAQTSQISSNKSLNKDDAIINTDEKVSQTIAIEEEIGFQINGFEDQLRNVIKKRSVKIQDQ